jgi:hypothetical protein
MSVCSSVIFRVWAALSPWGFNNSSLIRAKDIRRGRPLNIYLVYEFIVSSVALAESALLPSLAIGLAYKYLVSVLPNTDKFPYLITSHSPLYTLPLLAP